ncbi:hypothetical protein MCUN1_002731 [Malassezia cuniculi]|uniref:Protein-tyrosine-phosphatase n=1 Tax=Malassezia cuniculi TaxID=948313 RepID=A0AAF0J747_9BASI|nr:hypothetical protein MCUN1_002731 [Malassezia cuniculi]
MSRLPLTPPIRFGTVAFPVPGADLDWDSESDEERHVAAFTECLYRGAYPKQRNLRFLQTLHLRTIVSLTPKPIDSDPVFAQWAREQNGGAGIRLVHIRTEKPKEDSGGLSREGAARAIAVTLDRENLPLYIHCLDGIEATSTFVACLRRLQGWSDVGVREEFARGLYVATTRIGGAPFDVPKHLAQFVERFGQPDGVRLPPWSRIPCWLWPMPSISHPDLASAVQHTSIKLHFEPERPNAGRSSLRGVVWSTAAHRSNSSSWLSHSEISDYSSVGHISEAEHEPSSKEDPNVPDITGPSTDLRTPRARPTYVDGDIPPLSQMREPRVAEDESLEDIQTPLVKPSDTRIPTNNLDVLDLDDDAEAEADTELDEEELDDDYLDEEEDVRRLEALDLEGF